MGIHATARIGVMGDARVSGGTAQSSYLGFLGWPTRRFAMALPPESHGDIPDGFYEIYPNFTPADGRDSLDSGVAEGDLLATLFPAFMHRIDQAWQVTHVGGYLEIAPESNAAYALTNKNNAGGIGNPIEWNLSPVRAASSGPRRKYLR